MADKMPIGPRRLEAYAPPPLLELPAVLKESASSPIAVLSELLKL